MTDRPDMRVVREPITRRAGIALIGGAVAGSCFGMAKAAPLPGGAAGAALTPEMFGARGDGRSDDSEAFGRLSQAIVARRGGVVLAMRAGAVYRVGRQQFAGRRGLGYAWRQQPMLSIMGVDGLRILGNGATIKLNDGLHFGSFDPVSGVRYDAPRGGFSDRDYAATIGWMLDIVGCANVSVEQLTLDGNLPNLVVGGYWGGTGIQQAAIGVRVFASRGVTLDRVAADDHGQDGFYMRGLGLARDGNAPDAIALDRCSARGNGRQGLSIVGGSAIAVRGCAFRDTGQGAVSSAPRAGVDIEPNGQDWASDLLFENCLFENNAGIGLVTGGGNSRGVTIRDCTFWQGFAPKDGVTRGSGDALWITRDDFLIEDCTVNGAVTHLAASTVVDRTNFRTAHHPLYGLAGVNRTVLVSGAQGTFTDCSFTSDGGSGSAIFAGDAGTYRRCTFRFDNAGSRTGYVAQAGAGTTLEDCSFTEGPSVQARSVIKYGGGALTGQITVAGPHIRWGSPTGPVGRIAPTAR